MKEGNLPETAQKLLGRRIPLGQLESGQTAAQALSAQTHAAGHRGEVTLAQAIVLAMSKRALDGDRGAAEFLMKLADRTADAAQAGSDDGNVVVRVQLDDAPPGEPDGAAQR